jgi:alpha 1,2-mannosyltransferase
MWSPAGDMIARVGSDVEKVLWTELKATACDMEGRFRPWDGKPKLCEKIGKFIDEMSKLEPPRGNRTGE